MHLQPLGHNGLGVRTNKITEEDVRTIREIGDSVPREELAERYGISTHHVYRIIARRAWQHVL